MAIWDLIEVLRNHIAATHHIGLQGVEVNMTQLQKDDINCGRFMTDYIIHRREKRSLKEYTQAVEDEIKTSAEDGAFITRIKADVIEKMIDAVLPKP